jgi:integrative and conjugative element protein (TIGR02256 family)
VTDVFVANDHSVAIVLTRAIRESLMGYCVNAGQHETGGILVGHYTPLGDQAVITQVSGAPPDSKAGRSWFVRGFAGLQQLINVAWRRRNYYLGEWHFHPFAAPDPSDRDRQQILEFSRDRNYRCPEPILVVVGGDPAIGGELSVGVVLKGRLEGLRPWRRASITGELGLRPSRRIKRQRSRRSEARTR